MKTIVLQFWSGDEPSEEWEYEPEVNQMETIEAFIEFLDDLQDTDNVDLHYTITARLVD